MHPINIRLILRVIGILLCLLSIFMLFPLVASLIYKDPDYKAFLQAIGITSLVGLSLIFISRNHSKHMAKRDGFIIVAATWVFISLFGMLPYLFYGSVTNIADAYFETMSGFTTTGATIMTNINAQPHGILFWRCMTQWLGGMGIILFTLAILPMLNTGAGLQLFNAETTGLTHSKLRPRISETAKRLWFIYLVITVTLITLLTLGPMNLFDSICNAFSTVATGGYSTKQESIAYWNSAYSEYIIILFMIISGINFSLVYHTVLGDYKKFLKDEEVRWFLTIIVVATTVIAAGLFITHQNHGIEQTIRESLFQVTTLITTTGFATADYTLWGPFFSTVLFATMFFGACAGSTSGGAKIIRLVVLIKNTVNEFYRHLHPNAVVPVKINGAVIPYELVSKTLAFICVFILITVISTIILTATGLTMEEAFGATLTSISNVGPGLGAYGPNGTFAPLSDVAKWTLSFVMLIGRLELFTVLIIFTPYFWKK